MMRAARLNSLVGMVMDYARDAEQRSERKINSERSVNECLYPASENTQFLSSLSSSRPRVEEATEARKLRVVVKGSLWQGLKE
jgi:hypothetical protein